MDTNEVAGLLHRVERDLNVVVLFACEAGSRSQGLHTNESDHDIKFIYVRPTRSYLGLGARDDTMENPVLMPYKVSLDGWDVQKALNLAAKGNAQLTEWLSNAHRYHELPSFVDPLRRIMLEQYSPKNVMYHYYGLAMKNWAEKNDDRLHAKTQMMITRALLIVEYMHTHDHTLPSWHFDTLLDACIDKTNPIYHAMIRVYQMRRSGSNPSHYDLSRELGAWIDITLPQAKAWCEQAPNRLPNIMQLEKLCLHMTLDSGRLF